jgi:hypothetical protein
VGGFLARLIVTYAYICFSNRSTAPSRDGFAAVGMLPYPPTRVGATASAVCLMPDYYRCPAARPVSCYALFK